MEILILGTPFETAKALDNLRLQKQIIECQQILKVIDRDEVKDPCMLQYKEYEEWLNFYLDCLVYYHFALYEENWTKQDSLMIKSRLCSKFAMEPPFHTQEYFNQMGYKLYLEDKEHYKYWAEFRYSSKELSSYEMFQKIKNQ
jgi:hypothetical protein